MRKYRNQIFLGLVIALGIYIVFLLVADSQLTAAGSGNILESLQLFRPEFLLLVIACQLFVVFFRFLEWHYYLGVIDARDKISLADSLVIFVSAFTMVVSPGKAAEILKSVFLKMKTDVPVAVSAPVVLAERIVDGLAVIVIMVLTLLFAGDSLNLGEYNGINYNQLSRTLIFSSAGLLAFGLVVVQIRPLAYFFLNLLAHIPVLNRLHQPLVSFYESSREIFNLRHVIPMTFVGTGVYASSSLGFMFVLMGFGVPASWELFLQVAFIVGVSSAIGALSFVPNGAGVTEISNTGMLLAFVAPLYIMLTPAVATAAALIQGFFHKWFRVLVGLAVAVLFRHRLFSDDLEQELQALKQAEKDAQPKLAQQTHTAH
jgi:uncharacterized protein (TIRG00374 family)